MVAINSFIYVALFAVGVTLGVFVNAKFNKCPTCPECPSLTCPPSVSLQGVDVSKINNKKGNITYSPSISNVNLVIQDTSLFKRAIREALKRQ